MNSNQTHKQTSIRFKRWSRKSYAVFAGIHKVISIGALSAVISEKSLKKVKSGALSFLFFNNELFHSENDEAELEFSLNEIQLAVISTPAISNVNCHQEIIKLHYTAFNERLFFIDL